MSQSVDSEPLRSQAPRWSLAGDEQLLKVLQNMHQKLLSKCQEVDASMEQMTAALDDANISLQNVNNKFMALSNSQFIESRVYDDDVDVAPGPEQPTEPPLPLQKEPNLDSIKRSLAILERLHEPVTIHDTDIDSDSEDDVSRVVLKPRDLYAHRPLPYIIGSQAWKNKWHAGLIVEDSDTDSSTSKPAGRDSEQYSESDSEAPGHDDGTISQSSGDLSPEDPPEVAPRSQAAVAAELARRLGGPPPQPVIQEPPPASYVPENVVKNIYKPQAQVAGTIFPDEPPPIEECQSEESDQGDIFADLHKNQPYNISNKERSRAAEDLFDFNKASTGDVPSKISTSQPAKQKSTLFEDESEPELFAPKPENNAVPIQKDTGAIKKPVGGISLFGSNKGSDSIGAAILRRNQKQSSSEDEADSILPQTAKRKNVPDKAKAIPKERDVTDIQTDKPTEKDIFNNLFTKPTQKKNNDNVAKDSVDTKKVDIFGDNIFDDIDDIFTSNVKNETNVKKSLFDENDELFAEIAVKTEVSKKTESLLDSDDDLFNENANKNEINTKTKEISKNEDKNIISDVPKKTDTDKLITSIFDDDSDTDIFSDLKTVSDNNSDNNLTNIDKIKVNSQTDITKQLFATTDSNSNVTESVYNNKLESLKATDNNFNNNSEIINNTSRFDDDTDDIFSTPTDKVTNIENSSKSNPNDTVKEALIEQDRVDIPTNSTNDLNIEDSNDIFKEIDSPPEFFVQTENNFISEEIEPKIPSADVITSSVNAEKGTVNTGAEDSIPNDIFSSHDKELNIEAGLFQTPKATIDKEIAVTDVQTVSNKDLFSDIFTEPPVFEKPKEPKKSKNVNALFDDDSDDEGLFFKKSDVDDVKPETFQNKDMFDIFLDEPPSIDVDFTSHNTDTKSNNLFKPENIEPVTSRMIDDLDLDNALDSDLFKSTTDDKPETLSVKLDLELPVEKEPYANEVKSQIVQDTEKKVNKLKMNIKIDVNALLPGASPKKNVDQTLGQTDSIEDIDGQISSIYNNEIAESKIEESMDAKIVKSVSFEGEADSKVLDNKLSKERARIQVKRRPSTRRARKEAVRKSAIDIDDSTDNSSSIDDPPKSISKDTTSEFKPKVRVPEKSAMDTQSAVKIEVDIPNYERTIVNLKSPENVAAKPEMMAVDKASPIKPVLIPANTDIDGIEPKAKEVKSKIVYILHDEDIFNTPVKNTKEKTNEKPKLDILDDDDELFKPKPLRNQGKDFTDGNIKNRPVSNIGQVSKTKQKSSIFGDDDDEDELFKNNKTVKKTDIFNSDSDDDLFTGKNVRKAKVDKIVVKGSLFGDDDDGDDLFGVKTKKIEPTFQSKPSTSRETAKSTEPVYDDPLSLLSDDE